MSKTCEICCENYNNSTHAKVRCEYIDCQYDACKTCVRTYLIGTSQDPNCMKCNKTWSEDFIVKNLNRSFCEKEYKQHRKELLLERELSKVPETMIFAEQSKKVEREQLQINLLNNRQKELNKELKEIRNAKNVHYNNMNHIRNGTDNTEQERRKFIMACPHDNCRGFLSSQYKCELCEMFTCPHCLELIGASKDIPHTCNPDSVASAEFIKKDTKPCPKCGTRIHKIQGCNQMWCTQCHVAFNYDTGKIDTGHVHNPEYYRYLQQQNNGLAPRNPGDVICGGLLQITTVQHTICPIIQHALYRVIETGIIQDTETEFITMRNYLLEIHRTLAHISYVELPRARTQVRELEDQRNVRVEYILNKITRDELKDKVYKNDQKRKKSTEELHLYELINAVGTETFNQLNEEAINAITKGSREARHNLLRGANVFKTPEEAQKFIDLINEKILAIDNLRDYCNERFAKISITYNQSVTNIDDLWSFKTKKFKISEITED